MAVLIDDDEAKSEIAAYVTLIRSALEPQKKMEALRKGLSLDFIRPRISQESLRQVGIKASSQVLTMMRWWPRVRLAAMLDIDAAKPLTKK